MNVLDSPPKAVYFDLLSRPEAVTSLLKDFNIAINICLEGT
jgi:hypothetical protein